MINKDTLIIITARAGSKGIPHKNLKILSGKPLVQYTIETCLSINDCDLVVNTDSLEIIEICNSLNVETYIRPGELGDDFSTLDDVIFAQYRAQTHVFKKYQYILTVQPTSPLLVKKTLHSCREALSNGYDSVITVKDARHLHWSGETKSPTPLFSKRLNRQQLPPLWAETGGCIGCNTKQLATGKRVSLENTCLIEVSQEEGIDIDNLVDFYLAEKILDLPSVAIITTGNKTTGLGHCFRTLELAKSMNAKSIMFYLSDKDDDAVKVIENNNYKYKILKEQYIYPEVAKNSYDLVVIDRLNTNKADILTLKSNHCTVVSFEDLGSGNQETDLTINALYEFTSPNENLEYGWKWFCLRQDFQNYLKKVKSNLSRSGARNLLLSFGGTDPMDYSYKCLDALIKYEHSFEITINLVVGIGYQETQKLERLIKDSTNTLITVNLYSNPSNLAQVFHNNDLAITSNGRTVYELTAMGVPMITLAQNEREMLHPFSKYCEGIIFLGKHDTITKKTVETIVSVIHSKSRLCEMKSELLKYDLLHGTDRVLQRIKSVQQSKYETLQFPTPNHHPS